VRDLKATDEDFAEALTMDEVKRQLIKKFNIDEFVKLFGFLEKWVLLKEGDQAYDIKVYCARKF
jgi:hypothetical protein